MHLTAHKLFAVSRHLPPHESLVDPLHSANQLISGRTRAQRPGMDHACVEAAASLMPPDAAEVSAGRLTS